ncbi:DUF2231 domain-containing protein [Nonomuraea sp. SBT364]|uniref:DUF2231 domain-containing protein n=1 Tax=Nonomuraea sp. SBT364 TaxID=1580530 RepID=UPI00066C274D|nr:DUF2231 domain-containing protein [Nonomuraea sp. SBT364]
MSSPLLRAKRPSTPLAGPYGHPLHPMLVTVPIGAWVASLVFDLASLVVGDAGFLAKGALWLIAIGVIGAVAAAAFGFLDFLGIEPGTAAFRTAVAHLGLNLAVTALFGAAWAWRAPGGPVGAGQLALSAAGLAVLAVSGALGGRLAYRYGVRVADEATQAGGFQRS